MNLKQNDLILLTNGEKAIVQNQPHICGDMNLPIMVIIVGSARAGAVLRVKSSDVKQVIGKCLFSTATAWNPSLSY